MIRQSAILASYLALVRENKILLLRRFNTGYNDNQYSLVAGHVDSGETFTQCIIRESKEEAGIIIKPEHLTVVHIMYRNSFTDKESIRVDLFFTASHWDGDIINNEPHKCDDLSWFELTNLPNNIIPYIKLAIDKIQAGVFYSEYGFN